MAKRNRKSRKQRGLGCEPLELRSLLAGDCSPWQNPDAADDVNADGDVSPIDALITLNTLNENGAGELSGRFAPPALRGRFANALSHFVDTNGDTQLSSLDALLIINALNQKAASTTTTTTTASATDDSEATETVDASDSMDTSDTSDTSDTTNSSESTDTSTDDTTTTTDDQPDTIGPDAGVVTLVNGFGRTKGSIDVAGDADVFQVTATQPQLAITLFVPEGQPMQISIVDADGNTIDSISTDGSGSFGHATVTAEVTAGDTYYLVVTATGEATGTYFLGAMNFDPANFTPIAPPAEGGHHHGHEHDHDHGHVGPPEGGPHGTANEQLFTKLDANSDGTLSLEEFEAIPAPPHVTIDWTAIFSELDSDGDGSITAEEFAAGVPIPGPSDRPGGPRPGPHGGRGRPGHGMRPEAPPAEDVFAQLDSDDDDLLTQAELEAKARSPRMLAMLDQIFAEWDADGSGDLTLDEFTTGMTARA